MESFLENLIRFLILFILINADFKFSEFLEHLRGERVSHILLLGVFFG